MAKTAQIETKIDLLTAKIEKLNTQLKEVRELKAKLTGELKEAKTAEKGAAAKAKVVAPVKAAPAKQSVAKKVIKKK